MNRRAEKFSLQLKDVNAHTMQIMDIIDDEKSRIKQKQEQDLKKEMMQNGRR